MTTTQQPSVTPADSPQRIWLSPICQSSDQYWEDRAWASPAPSDRCECDECGEPWVEYVRSDLASTDELRAEMAELKTALEEAARKNDALTHEWNELIEKNRALEAVMRDCRSIAMRGCVTARAPECGEFSQIAQDLDAALSTISAEGASDTAEQLYPCEACATIIREGDDHVNYPDGVSLCRECVSAEPSQ